MFTPEERRIYGPYYDGQGNQVFADPVAVYRRLVAETAGNLDALLSQYNQGDLGVAGVSFRLANATVAAFELQPFDKATGKGTLQDEALALLGNFLDWRDQKKTPVGNSPISAPPMAQAGLDGYSAAARTAFQAGQRPPSAMRRTTPSA